LPVLLNGVVVDDRAVLELARAVTHRGLALKLSAAHRFRSEVVNLNSNERALVLAALGRGGPELHALRDELRQHVAWRAVRVTS